MTIGGSLLKKKNNSSVQFALTGSQVRLSPRPIKSVNDLCCSYGSHPMRRSISAFGFQSRDDIISNTARVNRPLSADNIGSSNRRKQYNVQFTDDIYDDTCGSIENEKAPCPLSENDFENIVNNYSEANQIRAHVEMTTNDLKPGLSSKPPLPFVADIKPDFCSNIQVQLPPNHNDVNTVSNVAESVPAEISTEQEAFDEIIALKFQRWFPDSIIGRVGDCSSSENEDGNVLSYNEERKFKSCEYRYEISSSSKVNRRTPSPSLHSKTATGQTSTVKNSKVKAKKTNTKIKSKIVAKQGNRNTIQTNKTHKTAIDTECEFFPLRPKTPVNFPTKTNNSIDQLTHANDSLQWLEKRDNQLMQARNKSGSPNSVNGKQHMPKIINHRASPKLQGSSFIPTLKNLSSETNFEQKKMKKITFQDENSPSSGGRQKNENIQHLNLIESTKSDSDENLRIEKISHVEEDYLYRTGTPNNHTTQTKDEFSWTFSRPVTPHNKLTTPDSGCNNSMYDEIVDLLSDFNRGGSATKSSSRQPTPSPISIKDEPTSPAKAIWTLIEEAEKSNDEDNATKMNPPVDNGYQYRECHKQINQEEPKNRNRLSDLLRYPSTELAQKVMTLQIVLDEKENRLEMLNKRLRYNEQMFQQEKEKLECIVNKLNRNLDQNRNEKRMAIEKLQGTLKELEKKHNLAVQNVEEKQKIELKKCLEKQAISDKMERDKWMESQSKLIKEKALKSLEPELNRMSSAHEETINDIHKFYKRQITELEDTLNRRITVQKEKMEAEKEKALAIEREFSRQKLEDEIAELEKRFQEQRKRLLAEVHVERESLERANEATLAIKEKENERKWEIKTDEMEKKIENLKAQHQEDISKIQQALEAEKQIWMKNQTMEFMEKENRAKEQYKKERDKHIEQVIEKLENESSQRELATDQKMRRLKEQYEAELNEIENANENLRRKLNESRIELQKYEDMTSHLRGQMNQLNTENLLLKEKHERLVTDQGEIQNLAKSELSTKLHILQSELNQTQLTYESKIKSIKSENERELSDMYNRVREMIVKKDETINSLKMQKDAALSQCNQLEKLLDHRNQNPF